MANYCFNTVTFRAKADQIARLQSLFLNMGIQATLSQKGQLPDFINAETGYFFDIDFTGNILTYATKWVPNIEIMCQAAGEYNAEFVFRYEETGNGIYGESKYENGVLRDISLDIADFARYEYDEGTEEYNFEGNSYKHDTEILEILLERRKAGLI